MNIFKDEEDIYGRYTQEELQRATKDFFAVSRRIKNKLGDKSYKLDQYLSALLEIANCKLNYDAAEGGGRAFRELRKLCLGILNYDSNIVEHEFYETVKEYIANHNFSYKERHTLTELYCALLTPKFTDYAIKKFTEEVRERLEIDTVLMPENYEFTAGIVDEEDMYDLNMAIKGGLIISSILDSFLHSINNQYLYCLLYRDPETSKQVFQLIMEENL